MSRANDTDRVRLQYNSDNNLNARIALHKRFSTNKYDWTRWVFDQYTFKANARVIEFGCGNGEIWTSNKDRIPSSIEVILTDLSEGMLNISKQNLASVNEIKEYKVMDVQSISCEDDSFDVAIANHMLYHVPNRSMAFSEISRVLKSDGVFYATTNGINNMKGLKSLVRSFDSRIDYETLSVAKEFGLENGAEQLSKYFDDVEILLYESSLHITEAKPLADYVLSLEGHINIREIITEDRIEDFYNYISDIISRDGSIDIPKSAGMFVARGPKK